MFNDCDEDQETVVLKHKQVAGQDLPDERQQEPLSQISFITMTTIVDYLSEGILKVLSETSTELCTFIDMFR